MDAISFQVFRTYFRVGVCKCSGQMDPYRNYSDVHFPKSFCTQCVVLKCHLFSLLWVRVFISLKCNVITYPIMTHFDWQPLHLQGNVEVKSVVFPVSLHVQLIPVLVSIVFIQCCVAPSCSSHVGWSVFALAAGLCLLYYFGIFLCLPFWWQFLLLCLCVPAFGSFFKLWQQGTNIQMNTRANKKGEI